MPGWTRRGHALDTAVESSSAQFTRQARKQKTAWRHGLMVAVIPRMCHAQGAEKARARRKAAEEVYRRALVGYPSKDLRQAFLYQIHETEESSRSCGASTPTASSYRCWSALQRARRRLDGAQRASGEPDGAEGGRTWWAELPPAAAPRTPPTYLADGRTRENFLAKKNVTADYWSGGAPRDHACEHVLAGIIRCLDNTVERT